MPTMEFIQTREFSSCNDPTRLAILRRDENSGLPRKWTRVMEINFTLATRIKGCYDKYSPPVMASVRQ